MLRVAALAIAVLLLAPLPAQAANVRVYLTRGEQLAYVQREADTPAEALTALLAGPTAAGARQGLRDEDPGGRDADQRARARRHRRGS